MLKFRYSHPVSSCAISVNNSYKIFTRLKCGEIPAIFKIVSLSGCDQQFVAGISLSPYTYEHQRESTCSCLQRRDIFHMCALHSVLPNDYTLRYYAGKVATFCSICLLKQEACLTPASWLWDITPHNSLTTSLAHGAACFKWQAGAAKWAFPCLGCQAVQKPPSLFISQLELFLWSCAGGEVARCESPPAKQCCQINSKWGSQVFRVEKHLRLSFSLEIQKAGLREIYMAFL